MIKNIVHFYLKRKNISIKPFVVMKCTMKCISQPQVTKQLLVHCDTVTEIIYKAFKDQTLYK